MRTGRLNTSFPFISHYTSNDGVNWFTVTLESDPNYIEKINSEIWPHYDSTKKKEYHYQCHLTTPRATLISASIIKVNLDYDNIINTVLLFLWRMYTFE